MRISITGNTIQEARIAAGLTVPELAQLLGVSTGSIHNWEARRESKPRMHQRNWENLKAALVLFPSNGVPVQIAPAIQGATNTRAVYRVTITGVVLVERGEDPLNWSIELLMEDEGFHHTMEMDSALLVPATRFYHPRDGGDK